MLVLALVVLLAFSGSVMAAQTGELTATGIVAEPQLGILVPANTPELILNRGVWNEQHLCNVEVVSTGSAPWKLTATANNANMFFVASPTYAYLTDVMYITVNGGTYLPFAPAGAITSPLTQTNSLTLIPSATGNQNVDIWVKQPVSPGDYGGKYTITFTFGVAKA